MKLNIAYLNDVHGYLEAHSELFYEGSSGLLKTAGGYSRILSEINRIRHQDPDTLVFDGGDTFHGTLPVVESKGEAIIPVLNMIAFDAMVGHWDFAYGPEQLLKLNGLLHFPILGINVYHANGVPFLKPYFIKEVKGVKVAVIGICSNIIDKTMPPNFSEGIKITDGTDELPAYIQEVKQHGADLVILLSHNGFPQDVKLLSEVNGIDICLSAHTHNRLSEEVCINQAVLIQAGCHGAFLGHLELLIEDRKIKDFKYRLIQVEESLEPDPEMEELVQNIMQPYQALKREIVGETTSSLHRYNTLNSTADQLLLRAIQYKTRAQVCFSNGWRYGAPIPAGPVTMWDLYNLVPMNPQISTAEMTGFEIHEMLEENLERTFSADPFKQMGGYVKRCWGLSVYLRIENPVGHRIQEIFVGTDRLNKTGIYKVGFITSQGVPEKYGRNRKQLELKIVEAMADFLAQQGPFNIDEQENFSLI